MVSNALNKLIPRPVFVCLFVCFVFVLLCFFVHPAISHKLLVKFNVNKSTYMYDSTNLKIHKVLSTTTH